MKNLKCVGIVKFETLKLNSRIIKNLFFESFKLMHLFFLSLFLFSCQNNNLSMSEVENKSERYFYKGEPYTGVLFDKNKDNILIEEFQVEDGFKKGYYKKFNKSGNKLIELNYNNDNKIEGDFVYYYDTDQYTIDNKEAIKMKGTIINGKLTGEFQHNRETVDRDLIIQKYLLDDKSNIINWESKSFKSNQLLGKYKNGIEELYYKTGGLKSKIKKTNSSLYSSNIKEVSFREIPGKLTGEYITYFENGNIKEKGNYFNGLKRGEWSEFYENGQIFKKDFYNENGKLSGPFEYYFEDGQTFQKGNYLNGNLDGWWEEHYKGGIPREIEYKNLYKDGEVIQYTEQNSEEQYRKIVEEKK